MAQKKGWPSTIDNKPGISFVGTFPACTHDESDSTAIYFGRAANAPAFTFTLGGWNLPARNPAAAQSHDIILRIRSQLSATSQPGQGGGYLRVTITMGGSTIHKAEIYCPPSNYQTQETRIGIPNTTAFWNGTASAISVFCEYIPTDQTQPSDAYILEVGMYYGEADGYIDVTANTAYIVTAPNSTGGVIQNPTNAANGTATFASVPPTGTTGGVFTDYLVRRIPNFSLPANTAFSGIECWDILSENANTVTTLEMDFFMVSNYPQSSPDSNTPYVAAGFVTDPSASTVVYPGQSEISFFGGPDDTMAAGGVNGWAGINLTKLTTGGYEFRSQLILFGINDWGGSRGGTIYMRDLKVRVFFNYTASSAKSLSLAEA